MKGSNRTIRIASRPSALAIKQVHEVLNHIGNIHFELISIPSFGDKNKDISLITNTISDIFTREIDQLLLENKADIAVHSAKDLSYPIPDGLEVIALLEALDKTDALVSRNSLKIEDLPKNAKIGTSSGSRMQQLILLRSDIEPVSIRGTIEERIAQVEDGAMDAVIVATCALKRLGLESKIAQILPFEVHPLQGNLVIVSRTENMEMSKLVEHIDIRKHYGTVYLVGAGPGKYEWLTIQAVKVIKEADVIFYDDLIDISILELSDNEHIYVGKKPGSHEIEQDQINELIYQKAITGKSVVRLKGGDPMIFGHAGEEIAFLESKLIKVEVIPGITSALGAAAVSRTPLTMRNVSSSLAFCTAHSKNEIPLPETETIVYYMGATNISAIAQALTNKGWPESTPVRLIYNIGGADQEISSNTLENLSRSAGKYKSPLIIIVGKVADKSNWHEAFENKKRILFTGTHIEKYKNLGNVAHQPLIEIVQLADKQDISRHIEIIGSFDWIIFTSVYSVTYFFESLIEIGFDTRKLASCKIASIGNYTSGGLKKYGIVPDIQAIDESSEGLIQLFSELKISTCKILIPRSLRGLPMLPDGLRRLKNEVIVLPLYDIGIPENTTKIDLAGFSQIIFTSPSGVENFIKVYGYLPDNIELISKGKETQKAIDSYLVATLNS